jgi:hypothetical protein
MAKTIQQRREERRQAQLDQIQAQISAGKLVVRQMTPEERAEFQPREEPKASRAGRRGFN